MIELEIARRAGDATLEDAAGHCRRIDDLGRFRGIEGVDHHLVVEGDDPHHFHVYPQVRLRLERGGPGAVAGKGRLRIGVEADRHHFTNMQAQRLGHDRRHDYLVVPLGIGQPAFEGCEAVLVGELAVDAAVVVQDAYADGDRLGGRVTRKTVRSQRLGVEVVLVLHTSNVG